MCINYFKLQSLKCAVGPDCCTNMFDKRTNRLLGCKFTRMLDQHVGTTIWKNMLYQLVWQTNKSTIAEFSVECWSNKLVQQVGPTCCTNLLDQHAVLTCWTNIPLWFWRRNKFCNCRLSNMLVQQVRQTFQQVGTTCLSNLLYQLIGPTFHSEFAPLQNLLLRRN